MKILNSLVASSLLISSAMALEPMAKEAGWSGFVLLGGGYLNYKNSEVAGNSFIDVEDKTITNLGEPDNQSTGLPVITGTVKYTLEGMKTEFFVGNSLEDFLRMDATLALGVRHSFEGLGIMGVRLLASTTPTSVWEDPFLRNRDRVKTDRTSGGIGLKWEEIFGSGFEVDIRARKMDFDNDLNGYSMIGGAGGNPAAGTVADVANGAYYINSAQVQDLERDGTLASAELLYTWDINDNNSLVPSIKFTNNDRDGDARDYKETALQLTHAYFSKKWIIATTVSAGKADYDTNNPVYRMEQDTDFVSGGMNVTYRQPFGWKDWGVNASVYVSRADSDVDFYDSELFLATLGMAYKF